jgi:hypothetical protein
MQMELGGFGDIRGRLGKRGGQGGVPPWGGPLQYQHEMNLKISKRSLADYAEAG